MNKSLAFISSLILSIGCTSGSKVNEEPLPRYLGIKQALKLGRLRLLTFAKKNNIENLLDKPLITKAVVLPDKEAFDKKIRELSDLPDSYKIPRTFVAAPDKNILWILPSVKIAEINPRDAKDREFYQKLVALELAHLLHVRYLKGNEDNMDPVWFYEGFAVVASDKDRGDYQKYGYIWRELLRKVSLKVIFDKSLEPDLNEWVIATIFKNQEELNN